MNGRHHFVQVAATKPHSSAAPEWKKLRSLQASDAALKLSHFRRVKQLGSGDVGLVDLVQIQVLLAGTFPIALQCQAYIPVTALASALDAADGGKALPFRSRGLPSS